MIEQVFWLAKHRPQWLALDIDGEKLTYAELWQSAQHQAMRLQQTLNAKSKPTPQQNTRQIVALHLPKSNAFVVMQLACWMADCAFMPLPREWPLARKRSVLNSAQCALIISDCLLHLPCKQILYRNQPLPNTVLKSFTPAENQHAYSLFTSGSSGKAKGVIIGFAGLIQVIAQQKITVQLKAQQRSLWLHDIAFDASIADIWVSLSAGACLVAKPQASPAQLRDILREETIHYIDLPAALLPYLQPEDAPSLHTILVGGEVSSIQHLNQWARCKRVIIAYGPSEATICTSMHVFLPGETRKGLIGLPIKGMQYHIDTSARQKANTETDNQGELIISGKGLAFGYFDDVPEKARFAKQGNRRVYRSGDLVRKTSGSYQFIGRIDRQFKLRGKLISPEEIEHLLLSHPEVSEAYALLCQHHIVLALAPKRPHLLTSIQDLLSQSLPPWMQASRYLFLESLPRKAGGKICQATLLKLAEQDFAAAGAATESPLLSALRQILQRNKFCWQDCLAEPPPDSLQTLEIIAAFHQFGYRASNQDIHQPWPLRQLIQQLATRELPSTAYGISCQQLEHSLSKYPLPTSPPLGFIKHSGHTILLTGATGNLGSQLLKHLSESKHDIICLARHGEAQFKQALQRRGLGINKLNIRCLEGDIAKERLGLRTSEWQYLTTHLSAIYHCAANTSLLESHHALEPVNMGGTYQIMKLLTEGCPKALHYASTLSVLLDSQQNQHWDESSFIDAGTLFGGYAQSKWQAEKLLRHYNFSNVYIYRFGLLVNDNRNPENNPSNAETPRDWFEHQLLNYHSFNDAPPSALMDFTPLSYATKLMLGIAQTQQPGVYHIHNPAPLSAELLCEAIQQNAQRLGLALKPGGALQHAGHHPLRIFKLGNSKLYSPKTQGIAQTLNIHCPTIDLSYLQSYLEALWQRP